MPPPPGDGSLFITSFCSASMLQVRLQDDIGLVDPKDPAFDLDCTSHWKNSLLDSACATMTYGCLVFFTRTTTASCEEKTFNVIRAFHYSTHCLEVADRSLLDLCDDDATTSARNRWQINHHEGPSTRHSSLCHTVTYPGDQR